MELKQPPFRPPPWLFGPAWTVLYGLMGYSAYRAWTTGMASFNPETRELTKVRIVPSLHSTSVTKTDIY
jgi:benzodiazapine receptor